MESIQNYSRGEGIINGFLLDESMKAYELIIN
jgi:hypothetical protein